MLAFLNRHITKIMGVLVGIQTQLMVNIATGQYEGRVSDDGIFWIGQLGTFLGVVLVTLGFKNTTAEKVAEAKVEVADKVERAVDKAVNTPPPNGFIRNSLSFVLAIVATWAVFAIAGCMTLDAGKPTERPDAVKLACVDNASDYKREQCGYALYGRFVTFQSLAVRVKEHPATPENIKDTIREMDAYAKPVADDLLEVLVEVLAINRELKAGKTTQEQLDIANARLDSWITQAYPKIINLIDKLEAL